MTRETRKIKEYRRNMIETYGSNWKNNYCYKI